MSTDTRWALILVTSLVLWLPALQGTLDGSMDLADGAIRYLLALAVSALGIGAADRLIRGYRDAPAPSEPQRRTGDAEHDEDGSEAEAASAARPAPTRPAPSPAMANG